MHNVAFANVPNHQSALTTNPVYDCAEVRPSSAHGMGLFAKIPLPKGTVWWRAEPADVLAVSRRHFEHLQSTSISETSEQLLEAILHHGYYVRQMDAIIYICDIARYTNHSPQPNSVVLPNSNGLGSITTRDIPAGEEITENYASFDRCTWARMYGEFGRSIGCW